MFTGFDWQVDNKKQTADLITENNDHLKSSKELASS